MHMCTLYILILEYTPLTVILCHLQDINLRFNPSVKELHPKNLDYPFKYSIKTKNSVTNDILKMNSSIGVSGFIKSFVSETVQT